MRIYKTKMPIRIRVYFSRGRLLIQFLICIALIAFVLHLYDGLYEKSTEAQNILRSSINHPSLQNAESEKQPEQQQQQQRLSQSNSPINIGEKVVLPKTLTLSDLTVKYLTHQRNFTKDPNLSGFPRRICQCKKKAQPINRITNQRSVSSINSTCSHEATDYGIGQKVRSYSLFIKKEKDVRRYVLPLESNMAAHAELFPGWITRIYSNISVNNPFVCGLICKYDTLFWCDIRNIPGLGDLSNMHGRTWRFLPLGDPTVDLFASRDMDNTVLARERAAVAEWEASDLPFHVMRDNPGMGAVMLAGLWGAKNHLLGPLFSKFLQKTLIQAAMTNQSVETWDETILKDYIHGPYHKLLILAHDSYYCKNHNDFKTLPFPTQRIEDQTVGELYIKHVTKYRFRVSPCPIECRPSYGKNWVYC